MVFVDSGKNQIRNWMGNTGPTNPRPAYMALGSIGSPLFVSNNSGLRYEVDNTRRVFDSNTGSSYNKLIEFEMILPTTEPSGLMPVYLRECELSSGSPYNALSVYSLSTFAGIEKANNIELQTIVGVRIQ